MMQARTPRTGPVIAIDGPAGAGKSTIAAYLARRFGLLNLETGGMYRAFALKAQERDVDLTDELALMQLAATTRIALDPVADGNRVILDGTDVSGRLREPEVTAAASRVSVHPAVRQWMVEQQRALGAEGGVVMEGRDIGTVVFPDATVKIFLDASPEARGARRFQQSTSGPLSPSSEAQGAPGESAEAQAEVLRELKERDARDRNRADSPLCPAPDAILLDSTAMTLDEVLTTAERIVAERIGAARGTLALP